MFVMNDKHAMKLAGDWCFMLFDLGQRGEEEIATVCRE
jgi:hypothetical protein